MKKLFTITLLFASLFTENAMSQVIMRYGPEIDSGWGDANCVVTPYVLFPDKITRPYAGNSITRVYVGLKEDATNCYLYIKDKPETQENLYKQKIGELKSGWNEIVIDTPFEIKEGESVAIGYKASFSNRNGVGYSNEKFSDGDRVYYNSKSSWTSTGGSVCIKALVEGDNMPVNEMLIGKIADKVAGYDDKSVPFSTVVRNTGSNTIESYEIETSFDGVQEMMSIQKEIPVNESDTIFWEVPSTVAGTHEVAVSIINVNGQPDTYADNNTSGARLTVRDKTFARRVVCEEYGGTWCGFCPRGIVGLELMTERHPGDFIGISVHGEDPLEIDPQTDYSYSDFIASCPGAPMCNVNRKLTGDPYNDIFNFYELERMAENHLAYEMIARWNDGGTAIEVESSFYSDIDISSPQYNIAYTLTEDSITGYFQTNYYAGGQNGELYGWEDKDALTSDFVYNDIARCIYGGYRGMECRRDPMAAYERYNHYASVPISENVTDARNLKITGQIIDAASGCIVNAMRVVPEGEPSGIEAVDAEPECQIAVNGDNVSVSLKTAERCAVTLHTFEGIVVASCTSENGCVSVHVEQPGFYVATVTKGNQSICNKKIIIKNI